jgi:site-specific recombinase XerD
MGTFVDHLESQELSRASIGLYNRYLLEFMVFMDQDGTDVDEATGATVAAYLQRLQRRELTNATRRIHLLVLRKFFAWRVSVGAREGNPAEHLKMRGVERNKVHTILSIQELEALHAGYAIEVAGSEEASTGKGCRTKASWASTSKVLRERNRVMIGLLVHQGMTTTEIAALNVQDLRLKEGLLDVQAMKFSKARTLELKAYVMRVRAELMKFHRAGEQALFLNAPRAGKHEAKGDSLQVWKRLSEELRKQNPRFQDVNQVRASVITHWLGKHGLRQVQYMAGHRFISSTERYQVGQIADLQSDIDRFHPAG